MISPPSLVTTSRSQRRTESPVFWAVVFASSLLIHIVLALGIRSLLQTVQVPMEPEPIAVEFAEATDASSPQPKQPPSQVSPSNPPPSQSSNAGSTSAPADPPPTRLSGTSSSSAIAPATPEPVRPVQSSPPIPSAPSRPQSTASPAPPPTPTNPVPNRAAPPNSATSPLNTRPSSPPPEGPIASGIRLPDVPGVPNPANNPGATARSSNRPINPLDIPKTPTPTKFLAQIQLLPEAEKSAIADSTADAPVTIQGEPSKELISDTSTCLLTPEAVSTFGKAVVLTVSLDEQGRLQGEPTVLDQSSSGNSRYDELAACVLKQWTFSPAYKQIDQQTRSSKPATIRVQVKITE